VVVQSSADESATRQKKQKKTRARACAWLSRYTARGRDAGAGDGDGGYGWRAQTALAQQFVSDPDAVMRTRVSNIPGKKERDAILVGLL
jgi:hypothetical protein